MGWEGFDFGRLLKVDVQSVVHRGSGERERELKTDGLVSDTILYHQRGPHPWWCRRSVVNNKVNHDSLESLMYQGDWHNVNKGNNIVLQLL